MKHQNTASLLAAALLLAAAAPAARAHHDTATMIARFTERIDAGETTPELYYRRATEYRVLRKPAEAEADLRKALERDPKFTPARSELARLLSLRGENEGAIEAAAEAVADAGSEIERAAQLVLLARLLGENAEPAAALHACESAFERHPRGEIEWYLLRAQLLGELGRDSERPAILAAGYAATGSIVLRNAWVDALLDNRRTAQARPVIEKELAASRLKSSWLLRRARALHLDGEPAAARADLEACLAELSGRIHPARPDITLVADRGLANALLGNADAARADLARARAAGADGWVTAALQRALDEGAR